MCNLECIRLFNEKKSLSHKLNSFIEASTAFQVASRKKCLSHIEAKCTCEPNDGELSRMTRSIVISPLIQNLAKSILRLFQTSRF